MLSSYNFVVFVIQEGLCSSVNAFTLDRRAKRMLIMSPCVTWC